jgi:Arc/MetJ-type ribon-helix-helix transcriptional regulator
MVTLTADVTQGIRKLTQDLVRKGLYKSQSEVVRDAIRQLAFKYGVKVASIEEVRRITKKAIKQNKETLAQATRKIREEAV